MATTIRLRRMGGKNNPYFRLVATERKWRRDGRFLDMLGYYNPVKKPYILKVDEDRIFHWMDHGAELSPGVRELLRNNGTLERWRARRGGEAPKSEEAP